MLRARHASPVALLRVANAAIGTFFRRHWFPFKYHVSKGFSRKDNATGAEAPRRRGCDGGQLTRAARITLSHCHIFANHPSLFPFQLNSYIRRFTLSYPLDRPWVTGVFPPPPRYAPFVFYCTYRSAFPLFSFQCSSICIEIRQLALSHFRPVNL